jgi:hypothetical protein
MAGERRIIPLSTHSGEVTLGIWLLQQPTHRDHGPTEHDRDASALQLHLKDPEVSPSLAHSLTVGLEYLQSTISLSPSSRSAASTPTPLGMTEGVCSTP